MKQRILVVEDEVRIAHWIKRFLEEAGFEVDTAHDGLSGLNKARMLRPDLVMLDLMLPGLSGIEICNTLRAESDVPIIILTAKGAQPDRISGLKTGADDYIVKPFDPEEVVVRAQAVLRRTNPVAENIQVQGGISLDESARTITINGQTIQLSATSFALLAVFVRHPNQVLSREQLINQALGDDFDGFDRSIDSYIRRLRQQLARSKRQPIQTVYGAGYKFVPEEL